MVPLATPPESTSIIVSASVATTSVPPTVSSEIWNAFPAAVRPALVWPLVMEHRLTRVLAEQRQTGAGAGTRHRQRSAGAELGPTERSYTRGERDPAEIDGVARIET